MEAKELKTATDDASTYTENEIKQKETQEKSLHCTSNCEDHSFYVEDSSGEDHFCGDASSGGGKDIHEVDIVGFTDAKDDASEVSECNNETEGGCSSSFSGSISESKSEILMNDEEVYSSLDTDNTALPFLLRKKKKLTDHWRKFIQPIMWRCKWLELRMKELKSQAQKYDKELELYSKAKEFESKNIISEEIGSKESQFSCHTCKNGVLKRMKRKRVEETTEIPSYMLNHNLFSYQDHRKSFADGALLDDSFRNSDNKAKNVKTTESLLSEEESQILEHREGDDNLENIILKIEAVKTEALRLKNRVDKVLNGLPRKFTSINLLSFRLPAQSAEALTASDQNPPSFLIESEDESPKIISNDMSEDNARDVSMSETAGSSGKEGTPPKTEQASMDGPSRNVRRRRRRRGEGNGNGEEGEGSIQRRKRKKSRVVKEKVKTSSSANGGTSSRFKVPRRKRMWGKRRAALRSSRS